MKKLKVQFLIFFILLTGTLALVLYYTYDQTNHEEFRLWQGISENVYNQLQANISEFLIEEDNRSFSTYRYYYIPEIQNNHTLQVSPLAELPSENPKGLIGYFQIDPDGTFLTPYLPSDTKKLPLTDLKEREKLHQKLSTLTQSFQIKIARSPPLKTENGGGEFSTKNWIEAGSPKNPQKETSFTLTTSSSHSEKIITGTAPFPTEDPFPGRDQKNLSLKKQKSLRQKLYPNPFSIKSKLEKRKEVFQKSEENLDMETEQKKENDEKDKGDFYNIAQYQTFKEQNPENLGGFISPEKPLSILVDPFRARLVEWRYLLFYRKVWVNQKMYLQGFALDFLRFHQWLMKTSFDNSRLPEFANSKLLWEKQTLAQWGVQSQSTSLLFSRSLGYPLSQFKWEIYYQDLPHLTNRLYLHLLTSLLVIMSTAGLFLIYHTAAKEVFLGQKRQDFVSAVTHELKTPLTSIRMHSEMLEEGWVKEEPKRKEYYHLISEESDRLSRLIENVLQLSRLEKQNYRFNFVTQNPKEDFRKLADEFKTFVQTQGFEWEDSLPSTLPSITYDFDALKQILLSLIDNSLKFSKYSPFKRIMMKLETQGQQLIWSIADLGPGIPTTQLKKIFENFYRAENEMTRKTKGTGIGLAMAKMLAEGMGGKIMAQSNSPHGLQVKILFEIKI